MKKIECICLMSLFEWIAVLVSVWGVVLTIQRSLWCWIINIIAYCMYAFLFFEYKLYAETVLQICFMGMAFYGLWIWKQSLDQDAILKINSVNRFTIVMQIVFSMSLGGIFGWALHAWTDASLPLLDSQLAALSLLATYWTSRRYLVTWVMWILVDICYVLMFMYKELYLTAFLYLIFIGLAYRGWTTWRAAVPQTTNSGFNHK